MNAVKMKRRQIFFWIPSIIALGVLHLACGLFDTPIRRTAPSPSKITLNIVEMPKVVQKGESTLFAVKTDPMNICEGAISYTDTSNKWTSIDLPSLEADEAGICKWKWTAPMESQAGIAEFRVAAEQHGDSTMLIPQTFCIDMCPP